jgi:multidrug efflux system outer membrane protein
MPRHNVTPLWTCLLTAAVGAVASCTLGPDYSRPNVNVPATYKSATQPVAATQISTHWWTLFNDEDLTGLEEAALQNNPDLAAAMARIAQARATAAQVESQFYPQITLDPSINWAITPRGKSGSVTRIPFDLGYEIDIWGQVKRSLEAANATTQATADQYGVVQLTLEADVAQDYLNLRSLEEQDRIFTENVKLTQEQLGLTKRKLQAGIVGGIDVAQAQTQLDELLTQQTDIRRQRADTEHALAILTGKPPAEFSLAAKEGRISPPDVPPELPAEILRHRPDVAAAEQNLVAANAQVGVAITNFYPPVRLSGAAGLASVNVEHVLDWQSALLQIGPSVSVPIFEGGRLDAALAQSHARYDELVATYRGTILAAFRDVEVSLTDVHMFGDALDAQRHAVDSAREYLRLSRLEYDQGLESYLQLLDADRTLLTNQITESQLTNQRLTATVLLIKALGGGWEEHSSPSSPK